MASRVSCPRAVLHFKADELEQVNLALGDADPADKLLFLLREHGALGGKCPTDAIADYSLDNVACIASAWSLA